MPVVPDLRAGPSVPAQPPTRVMRFSTIAAVATASIVENCIRGRAEATDVVDAVVDSEADAADARGR
jgi:pyruvate kinase